MKWNFKWFDNEKEEEKNAHTRCCLHLVLSLKKKKRAQEILFRFHCISAEQKLFPKPIELGFLLFYFCFAVHVNHIHMMRQTFRIWTVSYNMYVCVCVLYVQHTYDLKQTNLNFFFLLLPLLLLMLLLLLKILNSYCYIPWAKFFFVFSLIIFLTGAGFNFPFFLLGHFLSFVEFLLQFC